MNTSPRRDIGGKTIISYMIMTPIENTLKKGQENGDATKVFTSAEIGTIDGQIPKINVNVEFHEVSLDGYRTSDGKKTKIKMNKKYRDRQLASIRAQKAKSSEVLEDR